MKMYDIQLSRKTAELMLYVLENYKTAWLTREEQHHVDRIVKVFSQVVKDGNSEAEYDSRIS